jgi:hypothetical protein
VDLLGIWLLVILFIELIAFLSIVIFKTFLDFSYPFLVLGQSLRDTSHVISQTTLLFGLRSCFRLLRLRRFVFRGSRRTIISLCFWVMGVLSGELFA